MAEVHEAGAEAERRIQQAGEDRAMTDAEMATARSRKQAVTARAVATVRQDLGAISEARGLREWHAAALCLEWRWRSACARGGEAYGGKAAGEMYGGILQDPTPACGRSSCEQQEWRGWTRGGGYRSRPEQRSRAEGTWSTMRCSREAGGRSRARHQGWTGGQPARGTGGSAGGGK